MQLADLMRHEHGSLSLAQRCSRVQAPAPLFTSLLNYRHNPEVGKISSAEKLRAWGGMKVLYVEERTNYPLTLSVDDLGQDFKLTAQTEAWVGPKRVCEYMSTALESLTGALEADPTAALSKLEVLPERERHRVLYEWNDTAVEYTSELCIHELFEEQARRSPEATAVVFEGQEVSYGELNRRANQLAHYLRKQGVAPDARVGICVERGVEMVVGVLAVLKAGAGYVPLDPAYPAERLKYMLQDSAPVVLLTQKHLREPLAGMDGTLRVIDLEEDKEEWSREPESNPEYRSIGLRPEHLAYVIYTSGSTGSPKGVMVEHRNVTRLFAATNHWFEFGANDRWTLFHSYGFDFSVWEMWGALIYGGRLVVVPKNMARSPEDFYKLICQEKVTVLNQTPSAFRQLIQAQRTVQQEHQLRYVIFGGEALEVSSLRPWYEQNQESRTQLVNMYGITETTVHVTYRALQQVDTERTGWSPIGCRIPDLRTYILDAEREPVPVGVVGELYIGGAGVARGYLNQPKLTAERFTKDPFVGDGEARMYRTGDMGRWLADGSIEFIGRNDFQVKIRGHRIELGEIEARLAEHEQVRDALVVAREDGSGGKRLVAYYTITEGGEKEELGAEQLRSHVAEKLPEYMVPAAFVRLEAMLLTPNGKLDRKALPDPEGEAYAQHSYEPPQTELEQTLANIWQELLGVERVGRHGHFFELGGHSLLAIKLVEQLRRANLHLEISTLFTKPVLSELAAALVQHREILIPPCAIHPDSTSITPEMLPLINLNQEDINRIIEQVPGGIANIQDIYALTPLQDGLLFHHMLAEEGDPYALCTHATFADRELLDRYLSAIQQITDRHDILRTSFLWKGLSQPAQVVWRKAKLSITEVELDEQKGAYAEQLAQLFDPHRHRMDLRQAPLLRFIIAREPGTSRWFALRIGHHLIEDALSVQMVKAEVSTIWEGRGHTLAVPQPFRNFLAQAQSGVSQEEQERFFRQMLGDVTEPTLPFGLSNVHQDGVHNTELSRTLPQALNDCLRVQVRRLGVNLASLCHLAWGQVLARCSGVVQVVFGTVLTGRMQGAEGVNNAVGFFINTLPLRLDLDDTATESALRRVHASLAELFTYENASLGLALRCSGVAAPTPLFSSTLNYRNYSTSQLPESRTENMLAGMEFRRGERHSNYPVAISFDDLGHSLITHLDVVQTLSAERVHSYFQQCLESLAHALENDPHMPVQQLEILTPEERQQLVEEWNATEVDFGVDGCVHELFERQAEQTPDRVAVEYGSKEITYRELDRRANQLARYLRKQGVGPEMVVGIWVERSAEMVVGVMGILKAGAAYMPLDGNYPEERLEYMIEDAQVSLMLVGKEQEKRMPRVWVPVVVMDGEEREWEREEEERVESGVCGGNLAYVIYTSGSTGKPKGVGVSHGGLRNYLEWSKGAYRVGGEGKSPVHTPLSFDLTVTSLHRGLVAGAGVKLVKEGEEIDEMGRALGEAKWGVVKLTPSHLRVMEQMIRGAGEEKKFDEREGVEGNEDRREGEKQGSGVLVIGGESLKWADLSSWQRRGSAVRLVNEYGPTETVVGCCVYEVEAQRGDWSKSVRVKSEEGKTNEGVPIGRPIANAQMYILDGKMELAPVGVRGEIYIGGAGLARGYVNRAEMTAERFVPNPFSARGGERLYRTGDVGRYGEDGNIEFVGRKDEQVKIRGYRIELGEIEARLKEHGLVEEAVVVAREAGEDGGGEKRLVAYVVMVKRTKKDEEENRIPEGGKLEAAELSTTLRTYLAKWLPEYMVPTAIVGVERIPLTANGKVDRKALPAPEGEAYAQGSYEPPQGEMEEILANLWQELLGVERVGRLDNFFELGGHSLLGVRLLARIWKAFGVELPITILFTRPRLEQLTQAVKEARSAGEQPLLPMTPISRQQPIPLSYAQQRLWFMEQLEPGQATYNMPFGLRLKGKLNADALENSLGEVIRRHEVLRTRFVEQSGELVQQVEDWRRIKLERVDLMGKEEGKREEEVRRRAEEEEIRGFDLRQGPLIRAVLMRVDEDEHVLLLTLHHIVSDGWSGEILVREMTELYGAYVEKREPQLGEIKIQYGDYAVWQRKWLRGEILEKQLKYWREQLAGLEVLELASDRVRPEGASHSGERLRFELDEGLSEDLKEISRREGVTMFMTLLAAFQVLLGLWTGQEDIVVGTDVANRNRLETQGLIGFFVNQLVLRTDLRGGPSFREVLRRVREMTLGAYAHQDVPFEKLVQDIGANRDIRRNPFFEVKFVLQSEMEVVMLPGLTITSVSDSGALRSAKLDMTLFMEERQGSLRGILEYRTSKFTRSRMLGFVEQYQRILRQVSDAMDTEIHLLAAGSLAEPVMLSAFQQAPK